MLQCRPARDTCPLRPPPRLPPAAPLPGPWAVCAVCKGRCKWVEQQCRHMPMPISPAPVPRRPPLQAAAAFSTPPASRACSCASSSLSRSSSSRAFFRLRSALRLSPCQAVVLCLGEPWRSAGAGRDHAQPSGSVGMQHWQKQVEPREGTATGARPGHQAEADAWTMHVMGLSGDAAEQPSLSMQPQKWRSSATIPAGRTSVESSASCISFSACACAAGTAANSTDGQAKPGDAPPQRGLGVAIGPRLMQLAPTSCSVSHQVLGTLHKLHFVHCDAAAPVLLPDAFPARPHRTCR